MAAARPRSATQTEAFDQCAIARNVHLGDVLQQSATTTDEQQQPAPGVVVVFVGIAYWTCGGDSPDEDTQEPEQV